MMMYMKHFDAYGVNQTKPSEFARYNISVYDFWDSFLPAFRMGARAGAHGVMCAHIAPNGQNSCSNKWLLDLLRSWGPVGDNSVVATDCGEIGVMGFPPELAGDCAHATAWMLNNGTDLPLGSPACGKCKNVDCTHAPKCFDYGNYNFGNCTFKNDLPLAIEQGLTDEVAVDKAVRRVLWNLVKAGIYDKVDEDMAWASLGGDNIGSPKHSDINYDMALQSHVLLKNEGGTLPLDTTKRTVLIGPMSGGYQCTSGYETATGGCSTLSGSLSKAANWTNFTSVSGCQINCLSHGSQHGKQLCNDTTQLDQAMELAKLADQIIVAVGIDQSVTGEGRDRVNITLPGQQPELVSRIIALNKPTILVLVNGAPLGIEMFVDGIDAIVESWQPGTAGMSALASLLLGRENRWGRLAVTMYRSTFVEEQALIQYSQTKPPGRTYKYYTLPVVFPFGAGMGYHTAGATCTLVPPHHQTYQVQCKVTHLSGPTGDEVVQLYHVPPSGLIVDHPLPIKRLIGFERIHLPAESVAVSVNFNLTTEDFRLTDKAGGQSLYLLRPIYMEDLYVEFVCKCIYVYFTYILSGAGIRATIPCRSGSATALLLTSPLSSPRTSSRQPWVSSLTMKLHPAALHSAMRLVYVHRRPTTLAAARWCLGGRVNSSTTASTPAEATVHERFCVTRTPSST